MPALGAAGYSDFEYDPSGTSWTFSGGAGISGNDTGFTSGNPNAPEGAQVAFLQGTANGISQSLDFAVTGSYVVSFQAAQRGNYQPSGSQTIEVLLDGTVIGTITPSGTTYASYSSGPIAVSAGTHTLTFEGLTSGDSTAFLDAVTVGPANGSNPYTATIDWGDGSTTTGTITYVPASNTFLILGSHTYDSAGTYSVVTSVTHSPNPPVSAESDADIVAAPLSLVAQTSGGVEGVTPTTLSGLFSDGNPTSTASDYTATITWGDGNTTSANVARRLHRCRMAASRRPASAPALSATSSTTPAAPPGRLPAAPGWPATAAASRRAIPTRPTVRRWASCKATGASARVCFSPQGRIR